MNDDELEQRLRDLGKSWPTDSSFVDDVLQRLDGESGTGNDEALATQTDNKRFFLKGRRMIKFSMIGVFAVAASMFAILQFPIFVGPESVSAATLAVEVNRVLAEQDSVHAHSVNFDDKGKPVGVTDVWFERGTGVAWWHNDQCVGLDNGTYQWQNDIEKKIVTRTKSDPENSKFELEFVMIKSDYERLENEDIREAGQQYRCYSLKNLAPFSDGKQRAYLYVDSTKRLHKMVTWKFKNEKWNIVRTDHYKYNVTIDPSSFKPNFGPDAVIVDLDAELDQLVGLENAVFKKSVHGFDYAVHRINRLIGGGIVALVSLRPSNEATNIITTWNMRSSPQFPSGQGRIRMAELFHGRTKVLWYMLAPRDPADDLFAGEESVKFKDSFSIISEGAYNQLVDIDVEVVPTNGQPITLDEAARIVHREQANLFHIPRTLDMGVKDVNGIPTIVPVAADSTSADDFAKAVVEHLEYWRSTVRNRELRSMEGQIKNGTHQLSVPGVHVSGMASFGDKELVRAARRKDLVAILASETSVTNAGLKNLIGLGDLKILRLRGTTISDEGLKSLELVGSLESLDLRETKVTPGGVEQLRKKLPSLKIKTDFTE